MLPSIPTFLNNPTPTTPVVIVEIPAPPASNALDAAIEHCVESFEGLHDHKLKLRSRAAALSNAVSF